MNIQSISSEKLLVEMQKMSVQAKSTSGTVSASDLNQTTPDFPTLLKSSIDQVNAAHERSTSLQQSFMMNDKNVNLQDVMVSMQKASLSFQGMVQVRNKLVTAYQEIMNTQV